MSIKNEDKFEEWQKMAEEDMLTAEILIRENGPVNSLCYHAQQTAEKYLKGYLVANKKKFSKSHQLEYLLLLCGEIDPSFENIQEEAIFLSAVYPAVRYPGEYSEFTMKDCKQAFEAANRIKDFVLKRI